MPLASIPGMHKLHRGYALHGMAPPLTPLKKSGVYAVQDHRQTHPLVRRIEESFCHQTIWPRDYSGPSIIGTSIIHAGAFIYCFLPLIWTIHLINIQTVIGLAKGVLKLLCYWNHKHLPHPFLDLRSWFAGLMLASGHLFESIMYRSIMYLTDKWLGWEGRSRQFPRENLTSEYS